jgi:hypothetical protein
MLPSLAQSPGWEVQLAVLSPDEEKRREIVVDMHRAFTEIDPDYLTDLWRLFFDRIMADMVGGQYPDVPK